VTPTPTERLAALGWTLPPAPAPKGLYRPAVLDGHLLYISGQIVSEAGAIVHPGRVDGEVGVQEARQIAGRAALQGLSAAVTLTGSLDRVRRAIRVGVYVASSEHFFRQPEVADGASETLLALLGEEGRPSRVAVGVGSLPGNAPVEVELLLEVA
jgi:enamine deaminase RidA (YjgF/YER057c/UK114 family)